MGALPCFFVGTRQGYQAICKGGVTPAPAQKRKKGH